jgi:tRNA dimethylallyltransferase
MGHGPDLSREQAKAGAGGAQLSANPSAESPAVPRTEPVLDMPCIAVVGPTGSGKSDLAIRLAQRFEGEILNTDSLQVYRYLDIGTAKPEAAEVALVPHHLLNLADPDQPFSAGDFVRAAQEVLHGLAQRGRLPILCGGTGLYFRALLQGISDIPEVPEKARNVVAERLSRVSPQQAHAALQAVDPDAAKRIHPQDRQRIARALEVFEATGKPLSAYQHAKPFRSDTPQVLSVGVAWDRAELYRRLNARVERMLARGLIGEVCGLLKRGYSPLLKPLRSIGYLEAVQHLQGVLPLEQVASAIQLRTRHYAKRQITWFKRHPDIAWFAPGDWVGVERAVERFIKSVKR